MELAINLYFAAMCLVIIDRLILTPIFFNRGPLDKYQWFEAAFLGMTPVVNCMWAVWLIVQYSMMFCLWFAYYILGARP